ALVVALTGSLVRTPLAVWRGWIRERRWGFSTQGLGGFLGDRAKGLALGGVLSALGLVGLVGIARSLPGTWPLVAAPVAAAFVLLLGFIAPVLLEPVFNRFAPLADEALSSELLALAARVGVPVREVLVADASRRTTKVNAYVSGIGRTRRVVVYDTLLARNEPAQIGLIVAHELGHRRARHVLVGTLIGMASAALAVVLLWAILGTRIGEPRTVPLVLLLATGFELAVLPFQSWLSRQFEYAADRFSLEATGDLAAFEGAHRELALANLSDLDPPPLAYALLFTHPTASQRIAAAARSAV
ncbi:MAG: M48 family metallopeptidase, partial [Gaiellaceae bacterium]